MRVETVKRYQVRYVGGPKDGQWSEWMTYVCPTGFVYRYERPQGGDFLNATTHIYRLKRGVYHYEGIYAD